MTNKQAVAIQELVKNPSEPVGKAMLKAGYTKSTSLTPKRLTDSVAFKRKLGALAKANNITIEQYMMNLGLGMQAMKQNNFTGEVTEDISTRLTANKQAERFIFGETKSVTETMSPEDIKVLMEETDEVKLQQLIFSRKQSG